MVTQYILHIGLLFFKLVDTKIYDEFLHNTYYVVTVTPLVLLALSLGMLARVTKAKL